MPTAVIPDSVYKAAPVEIVHVPLDASADEAGCHHWTAVKAPLVERYSVNKSAGSFTPVAATGLLHNKPLRKAPCADSPRRFAWITRVGRRCKESRCHHARHGLELACESRLDDFLQAAHRPRVESADNRRVVGQVDERSRPVCGDDLAKADLPVRLAPHTLISTSLPLRSFRNRFTSGSTSRSDRFARNLRWCSDSKSSSSISRRSGRACLFPSYF